VHYSNDYGLGSIGKAIRKISLPIIFAHTQHPIDIGTLTMTKVAANSAELLGVLAHKTIRVEAYYSHTLCICPPPVSGKTNRVYSAATPNATEVGITRIHGLTQPTNCVGLAKMLCDS
jgi:hypothetical protein